MTIPFRVDWFLIVMANPAAWEDRYSLELVKTLPVHSIHPCLIIRHYNQND